MLKALHKHFSVTVDGANGQKKKGNKQFAKGPYLAIRIASRNRAFLALNLRSYFNTSAHCCQCQKDRRKQ